MVFEELPVQNIAVGTNIMRFATMHTAKSVDNISGTCSSRLAGRQHGQQRRSGRESCSCSHRSVQQLQVLNGTTLVT